jgi:hypothetical protein
VLPVLQFLHATESLSMLDSICSKVVCGQKQKLRSASKAGSQFVEESPSASMSEGFLYSGQVLTPSQVQFDGTIFSSRAFSGGLPQVEKIRLVCEF